MGGFTRVATGGIGTPVLSERSESEAVENRRGKTSPAGFGVWTVCNIAGEIGETGEGGDDGPET
jgi:hypothetical protein